MPGPLLRAKDAAKVYRRYIVKKGGRYLLRNSQGKLVSVKGKALVYHRGDGRFAVYRIGRDRLKVSRVKRKRGLRYMHKGDIRVL